MKTTSKIAAGAMLLIAIATIISTMSCRQIPDHTLPALQNPANKKYTDLYNQHLIDTAVSMLQSGDIILRKGTGADSYLLAMLNKKDNSYSHCGIVMTEHGYPFVYHSIGGEDNPEARLRRDSAQVFFSPAHNTAIAIVRYDYDKETISRLRDTVSMFYKKKPRFDLRFDLATDDYLYCSEFVYKAINRATGDTAYIGTSVLSGSRFVGIDDLFINPHAHLVWQTKFKQYLYQQK